MTTEESMKSLKNVCDYLTKKNISGIFYLPSTDRTVSLFKDEATRLLILDHAKYEMEIDKVRLREEAIIKVKEMLDSKDNSNNMKQKKSNRQTKRMSYI